MNKIFIEIEENNLCKVTTVENGAKKNNYINYEELLNMLKVATYTVDSECSEIAELSEIFPNSEILNTIQTKEIEKVNAKWYILHRKKAPQTFKMGDKKFENVGVPNLLFAIKVYDEKIAKVALVATKDSKITGNTVIYNYPFSNVFNGRICWGGNMINDFIINGLESLEYIPDMFFSMPNNKDGYMSANNSNMKYEELLESLVGKEFNDDILKKSYRYETYNSFVKSLG